MNNQAEREAFYAYGEAVGIPRLMQTCGEYHAFQAGAAWQREQVKGLVEALEAVEQEHILRSRMQDCVLRRNGVMFGIAVHSDKHAIEWQALGKELDAMIARRDEALATYHAAQEGK